MLDFLRRLRRLGLRPAVVLISIAALISGPFPAPSAAPQERQLGFQGEEGTLPNLDARVGTTSPTAAQEAIVSRMGATVRWNEFGTPHSLIKHGGFLATGLSTDPETAGRQFISTNRALFRLSEEGLEALELLNSSPIGEGHAVLFRQRFGDLVAGQDGLVTVGVVDGQVVYVSSSMAGDGNVPAEATISAEEAYRIAAADVGRSPRAGDITNVRREDGWTVMDVDGLVEPQRARLVALPTSADGVRPAYETLFYDRAAGPEAFSHFVDARTGEVLIRTSLIDFLEDNPLWRVFPASPPLDQSTTDMRASWCWEPAEGCVRELSNSAARVPWDVDPRTGEPTFTTDGNAAHSAESWFNHSRPGPTQHMPTSDERNYDYAWTNQWFEEKCNPATTFPSPQRNDVDAAAANLFAMHNRMHDWSYSLGFTEQNFNLQRFNFGQGGRENDPEIGDVQAGGISGGPPSFLGRDNANQFTPPDGQQPVTNMYLWQPIAAAFYPPCVDGDFDMTVIGHEYTHAISNRMVAGPDERLVGLQANAMGEAWSDLSAVEYLNEYGLVPLVDENPFAVGPYVTGDKEAAIRNYGMNFSPLNYSNIGYDLTGPQVHADGEIWSATNFRIREALIKRYNRSFPATDRDLQTRCADGELPADRCPGNRRWIQLVFDAWLLMPSEVSMVDARDAMLAADQARFGGANQDLLWNVFASRGLGENASSDTNEDDQPIPSFESPFSKEATLRFRPLDSNGKPIRGAQLFVGHYEGRSTPVADTDPATDLGSEMRLVPGSYDFVVRADGFGMKRASQSVKSAQTKTLRVSMPTNLASQHNGATAAGDGTNLDKLIDDTEGTNWASLATLGNVKERQVTVDLSGGGRSHLVDTMNVSAMLRPADPEDEGGDAGTQNRFSALRQFEILTCDGTTGADCDDDDSFSVIFTSPEDAFPSIAPRPRVPELIFRSFDVPDTHATHVRLRVLTNQCTGAPDYQGDTDNDVTNNPDCDEGLSIAGPQGGNVRAAELQVFGR